MKKVLFIEAVQYGSYYDDRYAHIQACGYDVHVLYGQGTIDDPKRRVAGNRDISALIAAAKAWHDTAKFDGVTTLAEPSILATADVAQAINLPYPAPHAALASRDKYIMRSSHKAGNVPHPDFIGVRSLADLDRWAPDAFPVIVKPAMGSASSFVFKADTMQELHQYCGVVLDNAATMAVADLEAEMPVRDTPPVVVEGFLDGTEHLIEGFVSDGVFVLGSLVDRVTVEGKTFDDDVHHSPSSLTEKHYGEITALVQHAVAAQGILTAPIHAEVRFHDGEPYIVEIAIRPGGGGLNLMAELSFGYDPLEMVARLACAERPNWRNGGPTGHHAAAACLIGPEGRIASIAGADVLQADDAVFFFKLVSKPGDLILRPPHGNTIVGFLGVQAQSEADAMRLLHEKSALLQVTVKETADAA